MISPRCEYALCIPFVKIMDACQFVINKITGCNTAFLGKTTDDVNLVCGFTNKDRSKFVTTFKTPLNQETRDLIRRIVL